jgi:sulfite reductase (NADPH) flavoprotein alpha-component
MTKIPYIPETAPFSLEQRAWLNGFLVGLFTNGGGNEAPQLNNAPAKTGEPLPILFGSQTGSAEGLAKRIAKEAAQRGFTPVVLPLNDHSQAGLSKAARAIIISSTWGDGDPPDNAANFWSWLQADAPRLENLQFAVLGLGDKNYSDFCGAAKKFDSRLESLGARRLVPRGECDTDYEATAMTWMDGLWEKLTPSANGSATNGHAIHTNGHTISENGHAPAANGHAKCAFSKTNPFPAKLLKNVLLNKAGSAKEVRHYEISLAGSGLTYEVGDALGIVQVNCPALVDEMLGALSCSGTESVSIDNTNMPLREAFTRYLDLCKPSQELLAAIVNRAPISDLAPLLAPERRDDLKKFLWGRDVLDLLRLVDQPFSLAELVPLLRKLAPRLYSISSSPKAHPGEVHLTVSAVRYESFGRERKGVASTFLADRAGDADCLKVFVQSAHGFKPPVNGDLPMIMVGPGTGIAPFRAFLEERKASGARGKNWLFFGDQKRASDYLYESELNAWKQDGHLAHLDLAFSRDQEAKVYVQDRMLENAAELWSWLEAGAHFYVCGDASRMAKDVDAALHRIIEMAGRKTADEAIAYVAKLKSEKRYQRDVY